MSNPMETGGRACLLLLFCLSDWTRAAQRYGTKIGKFNTHFHDVAGEVYAVDDKRIFIKDFNYDGAGPDAYFWAGKTSRPDATGFIVPDENGLSKPLQAYRRKDLLLKLPEGKTLKDIRWLSVWCRKFHANFADLDVPRNLRIPKPADLGEMSSLQHGVSSGNVMVLDSQTFLVPDFTYDGQGPAAYWWVSKGARQNQHGLRLKDENGSSGPLSRYTGKTVVISLPKSNTIYDFDWLGVWCEEFKADFGNVKIPHHLLVPPSLNSLGIKTQNKLNCEILYDNLGFELRWVVEENDVVMQLVGKIDKGDYMAFGLSKNDSFTQMVGADAVVTWLDQAQRGHAVDYYLESKQQCVGNRGSCPDNKYPSARDNASLMNAATVNGYTMITFRRPQLGVDAIHDQHIYSDGPQAVVWAIGQINSRGEASYHRLKTEGNYRIDFFRPPTWNCPEPDDSASSSRYQSTTTAVPSTSTSIRRDGAWNVPPIVCPANQMFRVQIGPTGGKKGYQAITGNVGWGIAWYVNGLLVPEITVQRGKTYTFLVEGGFDPHNPSRHHPLYITDDPEGGYEYKSDENKQRVTIFAGAGIDRSGKVVPTATGRLCEWKIPANRTVKPDDFDSFSEFRQQLTLECQAGRAGFVRWKPDRNTPDLVYYQCFTHRFLGWKIHVVDACEEDRILEPVISGEVTDNIFYPDRLETSTSSSVDYEIIYYDYVDEPKNTTRFDPSTTPYYRRSTTTALPYPSSTTARPRFTTVRKQDRGRRPHIRTSPQPVYRQGFVPVVIRTNSTVNRLLGEKSRGPSISRHDSATSHSPKFGERIRKPGSVPLLIPDSSKSGKNNFLSSVLPSDLRLSTLIPDQKYIRPSRGPLLPMLVPLPARDPGLDRKPKPKPLIPVVFRADNATYPILDHVLSLIAEDRYHPGLGSLRSASRV